MITKPLPQDDLLLMLAGNFHVDINRIPELKTIFHANKRDSHLLFTAIKMLDQDECILMFHFVGSVIAGYVSDVESLMPQLKKYK